jgi:hypothetical protein
MPLELQHLAIASLKRPWWRFTARDVMSASCARCRPDRLRRWVRAGSTRREHAQYLLIAPAACSFHNFVTVSWCCAGCGAPARSPASRSPCCLCRKLASLCFLSTGRPPEPVRYQFTSRVICHACTLSMSNTITAALDHRVVASCGMWDGTFSNACAPAARSMRVAWRSGMRSST